jgi:glycogen debranching enzyme
MMPNTTLRNDQFPILAASPRRDERTRVLKYGETFAVFDHFGEIEQSGSGEQGLYHEGTRHLSRLRLLFEGREPLLLSSTIRQDNCLLTVDLTNPDFTEGDVVRLPRDTVHLFVSVVLFEGRCYWRCRVRNYSLAHLALSWSLLFEADFVDIFEVRGTRRARRGELLKPVVDESSVRLPYRGLDDVIRESTLEFSSHPAMLADNGARFDLDLPPKGEQTFELTIDCTKGRSTSRQTFKEALDCANEELQAERAAEAHVETSNAQFNEWLDRSAADLRMMLTRTPHGLYPYAGVPWFNTAFGRDGIITALEYLWLDPQIAQGVLQYLAATQAHEVDPASDAEPGKILHETRRGEMANLGEIPFGKYYGTVDATPLFIILAHAYYERTADRQLIEQLWPNIEAALRWIDDYGDADGDGFIDYVRKSESGLVTQGWKDSVDSVFHADGRLADPPIALCEVQGYVYAAWRGAAVLAAMLERTEQAADLERRSQQLRARFDYAFWCDDIGAYALALDGRKQPCCVRTSNAGQLLFTRIAQPEHARRVADLLLSDAMFSGWGVRTVATQEARYNPISYHNGSVWPHDNALIAWGLAQYGFRDEALRILTGLFDASLTMDLRRMPELFCGFARREEEGPTLYPVACAPQSWAAASVFLMLQASIGLSIDATTRSLVLKRPVLPPRVNRVTLRNLKVRDAVADITLERHPHDVGVTVLRREGSVDITVVK